MVEVLVTTVVFVTAAFGVFTTISMLKPNETGSSNKLKAAYIGKAVLDQLSYQVDANSWFSNSSNLSLGTHTLSLSGYTVNYTVEQINTVPDLPVRKVHLIVSY